MTTKWRDAFSSGKGKGKGHPRSGQEGPEGALDGEGGQRHAPAALRPGKTRYSLYRRLGGPQGRSGRLRKTGPNGAFFRRV